MPMCIGIVKLGDFGIAKVLDATEGQAQTQIGEDAIYGMYIWPLCAVTLSLLLLYCDLCYWLLCAVFDTSRG